MALVLDTETNVSRTTASSWRRRWPEWIGYAAAAWSLLYGALILGLYWALGSRGFPFGEGDPQAALSVLGSLTAEAGAPVIAVAGVAGAVAAVAMARAWGRGPVRLVLIAVAWTAAVALTLVIPDYRGLMGVAYAFVYLVGAPFGWPPTNFFEAVTWPMVNQFLCILGGLIWAATAVAYHRRSGAAAEDGHRSGDGRWTTPAAVATWRRWAVAVAVGVGAGRPARHQR